MQKTAKLKYILVGMLITAIISSIIIPVVAANLTKQINATYRDIQIVIDGEVITPKDVDGNIVEPFIVDGTTYLPLRTMCEAIGYDVKWDDKTSTVYANKPASNLLYKDDKIEARIVEPLDPLRYGSFQWIDPLYKPLFEQFDSILKGTISNIREIEIKYWNVDYEVIEYSTLYDFTISEVFYQSDSLKLGDKIVLYLAVSSRLYPHDVPEIKKDIEYILFCNNLLAKAENDPLSTYKIADYYIFLYPQLVIWDEGEGYNMAGAIELLTAPINSSLADEKYKSELSNNTEEAAEINDLFEEFLTEKAKEYEESKR